jgi:hypothetical protein
MCISWTIFTPTHNVKDLHCIGKLNCGQRDWKFPGIEIDRVNPLTGKAGQIPFTAASRNRTAEEN